MDDTVSSAVLLSSLAPEGPSFLATDAPASTSGALHVSGGAHTDQSGAALIIDFQPYAPEMFPVAGVGAAFAAAPPTVSGGAAVLLADAPAVVAGALHHLGPSSG